MNKANVPCDLITGQERELIEGAKHKAVTVEMADVTSDYSCAVVDEIQMLGCKIRGFSFTRALLGISADELHLCGDAAAVPLINKILEVTDDVVEVQYYERLSPLVRFHAKRYTRYRDELKLERSSSFALLFMVHWLQRLEADRLIPLK